MAADNLLSTKLAADGEIVAGQAYVVGIHYRTTAVAGVAFELKDGGAGGTVLLSIDTDAVVAVRELMLPQRGILFRTDVYADLTNCDSITVLYEGA